MATSVILKGTKEGDTRRSGLLEELKNRCPINHLQQLQWYLPTPQSPLNLQTAPL